MFGPFNRQSRPSPEEVNWEGWTPPWMEREEHGPRGPFGHRHGFGGHFGPGHGWWHHGGHGQHWGVPDELLALRAEAAEVARTGRQYVAGDLPMKKEAKRLAKTDCDGPARLPGDRERATHRALLQARERFPPLR